MIKQVGGWEYSYRERREWEKVEREVGNIVFWGGRKLIR